MFLDLSESKPKPQRFEKAIEFLINSIRKTKTVDTRICLSEIALYESCYSGERGTKTFQNYLANFGKTLSKEIWPPPSSGLSEFFDMLGINIQKMTISGFRPSIPGPENFSPKSGSEGVYIFSKF